MIELVGVVLGVLLGFLGNHLFQKQRDAMDSDARRNSTTLELAKEFHSEQMIRARCLADLRFVSSDAPNRTHLLRDLYKSDMEQVIPMFQILHFYEKLSILRKHQHISESMAIDIFGENYAFWYRTYLSQQIELESDDKWKDWYLAGSWLISRKTPSHPRQHDPKRVDAA